jgi:hypothetical protein
MYTNKNSFIKIVKIKILLLWRYSEFFWSWFDKNKANIRWVYNYYNTNISITYFEVLEFWGIESPKMFLLI